MEAALRRRLVRDESGMTLVELLNVLVLMGILLAIAVPSYLGLKDRTNQTAAKSNLRNIVPAVLAYGAHNAPHSSSDPDLPDSTDVGYHGLDKTLLLAYDPTIDTSKYWATSSADDTFCIYTWVASWTAYEAGPGAPIEVTPSSSFDSSTCGPS
jgi:type IV pilus assembly protein PilA